MPMLCITLISPQNSISWQSFRHASRSPRMLRSPASIPSMPSGRAGFMPSSRAMASSMPPRWLMTSARTTRAERTSSTSSAHASTRSARLHVLSKSSSARPGSTNERCEYSAAICRSRPQHDP